MVKKEKFICEINVIIIMIIQKLRSIEPLQQKIKLPLPYPQPTETISNHVKITQNYLHQLSIHPIAQRATKFYLVFLLLILNMIS